MALSSSRLKYRSDRLQALSAVQAVAHKLSAELIKTSGHSPRELADTFCVVGRVLCDAVYGAILNAVSAAHKPESADESEYESESAVALQICQEELADLAKLGHQLPVDWLACVYEDLLGYRSDAESALTLDSGKGKKRSGSFYTPYELAEFAVDIALDGLVLDANTGCPRAPNEILSIRLVDPAMGAGTFLCAALARLADAVRASIDHFGPGSANVPGSAADPLALLPGSASLAGIAPESPLTLCRLRAAVAVSCLHGVDIDAGAVQFAKLSIATMCGDYAALVLPALNGNLKCGNSLLGLNPVAPHAHASAAVQHNSFNWHEQFPAIFSPSKQGFDVVVGNPPWEIEKSNSREFFQDYICDYWRLGKQEALSARAELCGRDQAVLRLWTEYEQEYERFSKFVSSGQVFTLQGTADPNAYKLFVELAYRIVKDKAVVSLVVPSGIYTDKGSSLLRETLLHQCNWQSIHGFQNNRGIFNIHRSFKFCLLTFEKGGPTEEILLNLDNDTVSGARAKTGIVCARETVERYSPKHFSILDISSCRDLELLEKISAHAMTLDTFLNERNFRFHREFDMTNDSASFELRQKLEENGYVPDVYGHWLSGGWRSVGTADANEEMNGSLIFSRDGQFVLAAQDIEAVAYPLYEGRMISHFDDAAKGWVSGKGRRAIWAASDTDNINPQYLLLSEKYQERNEHIKVGYLAVGSPTNTRSMIAACVGRFPCGNSVPVLRSNSVADSLLLAGLLNSFIFDYILRSKMSGNNVNFFLLQECLAPTKLQYQKHLITLAGVLSLGHPRHAATLLTMFSQTELENLAFPLDGNVRISLRSILDACIAFSFGLEYEDLEQILAECNLPSSDLKRNRPPSLNRNPKGFWRVDKHLPSGSRQTIRTLAAFKRIEVLGIEAVLREAFENLPGKLNYSELVSHARRMSAIRAYSH